MNRVVIHVGLQKTGSTLIQRNLNRNRSALSTESVGYHRLRGLNETDDIEHLPAFTTMIRSLATRRSVEPEPGRVESEIDWLMDTGRNSIIISDENILGPINHESGRPAYCNAGAIMERVIKYLSAWEPLVILYVRRQDTYLESTYLHRIHVGRTIAFDEYMSSVALESLDWSELADRLISVVGARGLKIVPYETVSLGEASYVNRFLAVAGVALRIEPDDLAPRLSNRSYSALALQLALRCNDLLEGEDLAAFRRFLQNNFSNATHLRPELLDDEQRAAIVGRYRDTNRRLMDDMVDPTDRVGHYT